MCGDGGGDGGGGGGGFGGYGGGDPADAGHGEGSGGAAAGGDIGGSFGGDSGFGGGGGSTGNYSGAATGFGKSGYGDISEGKPGIFGGEVTDADVAADLAGFAAKNAAMAERQADVQAAENDAQAALAGAMGGSADEAESLQALNALLSQGYITENPDLTNTIFSSLPTETAFDFASKAYGLPSGLKAAMTLTPGPIGTVAGIGQKIGAGLAALTGNLVGDSSDPSAPGGSQYSGGGGSDYIDVPSRAVETLAEDKTPIVEEETPWRTGEHSALLKNIVIGGQTLGDILKTQKSSRGSALADLLRSKQGGRRNG